MSRELAGTDYDGPGFSFLQHIEKSTHKINMRTIHHCQPLFNRCTRRATKKRPSEEDSWEDAVCTTWNGWNGRAAGKI